MAAVCRCFSTVASRRIAPSLSSASSALNSQLASSSSTAGSTSSALPQYNHVQDAGIRDALRRPIMASALLSGSSPDLVLGTSTSSDAAAPTASTSSAPQTQASSSSFAVLESNANLPSSSSSSALPPTTTEAPRQPQTFEVPPAQDPLISFLTNLMMKDGKKATARNHVSLVLSTLRLRTSQDPMPLLREAIKLAAPGIRMTQQKRGGKQVGVPKALNERQRVRKAISWILDASDKRKNPNAGGSKKFGERVAIEIEAVLNGSSDVLKKKEQLHAMATVNRANVVTPR